MTESTIFLVSTEISNLLKDSEKNLSCIEAFYEKGWKTCGSASLLKKDLERESGEMAIAAEGNTVYNILKKSEVKLSTGFLLRQNEHGNLCSENIYEFDKIGRLIRSYSE